MSFLNNQERTIDGINTFNADIFNVNEDLEVEGNPGSAGNFLKKNKNTNSLEWGNISLVDEATAGALIDFNGNTINVDLSEATTVVDMAMTDSILVTTSASSNVKIDLNKLIASMGTNGVEYDTVTTANTLATAKFILYGAHEMGGAYLTYPNLKSLFHSTTTATTMALSDSILISTSSGREAITLNFLASAINTNAPAFDASSSSHQLNSLYFLLYSASAMGVGQMSYPSLKSLIQSSNSSWPGSTAAHNIVEIRSANNDVLFNKFDTGRTFMKLDNSAQKQILYHTAGGEKEMVTFDTANHTSSFFDASQNNAIFKVDHAADTVTITNTNGHDLVALDCVNRTTTLSNSDGHDLCVFDCANNNITVKNQLEETIYKVQASTTIPSGTSPIEIYKNVCLYGQGHKTLQFADTLVSAYKTLSGNVGMNYVSLSHSSGVFSVKDVSRTSDNGGGNPFFEVDATTSKVLYKNADTHEQYEQVSDETNHKITTNSPAGVRGMSYATFNSEHATLAMKDVSKTSANSGGLAYAVFDGRATTLSLKHLGTESGGYYLGHTYFEANSQTSIVTYKNNNENDQCVFEHNKSTFKRTTGSTATGHPLVVIDHECAGVEAFSVKLISSSSDYNAFNIAPTGAWGFAGPYHPASGSPHNVFQHGFLGSGSSTDFRSAENGKLIMRVTNAQTATGQSALEAKVEHYSQADQTMADFRYDSVSRQSTFHDNNNNVIMEINHATGGIFMVNLPSSGAVAQLYKDASGYLKVG